uniref:Uncharacterized protein n=1 Tax=Rhizophora mucronata TaxID=61149 RepID=A0A2P2NTH6_RHIMU
MKGLSLSKLYCTELTKQLRSNRNPTISCFLNALRHILLKHMAI